MRKTFSKVAGLMAIGSLCTVATGIQQVAQGCFALVEKVAFTTTRADPAFVPDLGPGGQRVMKNPESATKVAAARGGLFGGKKR